MLHHLSGRYVALCASAFALTACGGGGSGSPTPATNPPVIAQQPQAQTVLTDGAATFSVSASGPGLSYQWKRNGVAIAGATATSYVTGPAGWADSGAQYTVVISNPDGSVTSNAASLDLVSSADQLAFETLTLGPSSSYLLRWNLNSAGMFTADNYAYSEFSALAQSPLTHGPQTLVQSAPVNLTSTLLLLDGGPTRVLKAGQILVVPATQTSTTLSYVGSAIQADSLAADNTTVAYSQTRSQYTAVSLAGTLAGSTDDFAHYHNSFFTNPATLNPSALYQVGSAYLKYTAVNKGDRYNVFDCTTATTGAAPTPCQTATSLTTAMTGGILSNSDGKTYLLADGTVSTVGGVPMWVATVPRPISATLSSTVQYRVYFELNGNVYTGALIHDGATLGGSYYISNPAGATVTDRLTFLPFQIRMNKAARDSIAAAMAI